MNHRNPAADGQLIFTRRHPEYAAQFPVWERSRAAYTGGAEYIDRVLIRHVSEIDLEFAERRRRAYYFNYPRAIAQRITQYALAVEPLRRHADPGLVEDWSRTGLRVGEVMRQLSTLLNVYGRAWLLVEAPRFDGTPSLERARRERLRPYATALSPLQVVDWACGADGTLSWALIDEWERRADDPFLPETRRHRRRLLRRDSWQCFENTPSGVIETASGINPIGRVPLVAVTEPDGFGLAAGHWFEDVVRISEAILNNESEAQMNVVKQMFGLLVISESFARGARRLAGTETAPGGFAATVARSAAVIESVEEKGISRFISPSGVETATIREENLQLKQELFEVVGLAFQSRSREAQTAESKAWDFQNASQFLAARADLLEQAELEAWKLMRDFDPALPVPDLVYNRKFAVRDLAASIQGLLQLASLDGGPGYRRVVGRTALELIDGIVPVGEVEKRSVTAEIEAGTEPAAK